MIKEDSLGNTITFYLMLHGADSLHLEDCTLGPEAGSFYRIKKKKKRKKKLETTLLAGATQSALSAGRRSKDRRMEPRGGQHVDVLRVSGKEEQRRETYPHLGVLTWHPRPEQSHLGPRKLFQRREILRQVIYLL